MPTKSWAASIISLVAALAGYPARKAAALTTPPPAWVEYSVYRSSRSGNRSNASVEHILRLRAARLPWGHEPRIVSIEMPRLAGVPLTIMPGALDVSIPSHRPCSLPGRLGFEVRRKSRGKRLIDYGVIICWSHQDEAFLVEVPELPGCMADGSTYKEAVDNAEVVIREWIRTAEELGRPIPQPEGRPIFA